MRFELENIASVENAKFWLAEIKKDQKEAWEYKHYVAWENLIASEIVLYSKTALSYDKESVRDLYQNKLKLSYIKKSLLDVKLK